METEIKEDLLLQIENADKADQLLLVVDSVLTQEGVATTQQESLLKLALKTAAEKFPLDSEVRNQIREALFSVKAEIRLRMEFEISTNNMRAADLGQENAKNMMMAARIGQENAENIRRAANQMSQGR